MFQGSLIGLYWWLWYWFTTHLHGPWINQGPETEVQLLGVTLCAEIRDTPTLVSKMIIVHVQIHHKLSRFLIVANLQQSFYPSRPRMFMKTNVCLNQLFTKCRLSIFLSHFQGLLRTALTFQCSLNMNQFHFITRSAVLLQFYCRFFWNETFIVAFGCRKPFCYVHMHRGMCMPHTITVSIFAPCPRLCGDWDQQAS